MLENYFIHFKSRKVVEAIPASAIPGKSTTAKTQALFRAYGVGMLSWNVERPIDAVKATFAHLGPILDEVIDHGATYQGSDGKLVWHGGREFTSYPPAPSQRGTKSKPRKSVRPRVQKNLPGRAPK
jgi:hypothetical protein